MDSRRALAVVALLLLAGVDHGVQAHGLVMVLACAPLGLLAWQRHARLAGVAAAALLLSTGLAGLQALPFSLQAWLDHGAAAALLFAAAVGLGTALRRAADGHADTISALERRAFHDRLTDLPNRPLFLDRLAMAIAEARRRQHQVALLFIDLDGFKAINDTHGHRSGDQVLRTVAARLLAAVRSSETVARLGGDEFAIVLSTQDSRRDAGVVADKVLRLLAEPIAGGAGREFRVGASIGISAFPQHGAEIDRLLACADTAMYQSKQQGRQRWTFFHDVQPAPPDSAWFEFDESHEVGVPEVDRQHRQLIALAEQLNSAVKAGEDAAALRRRFDELLLFTEFHFASEERLMQASGYPDSDAHGSAHAQLLAELGQYRHTLQQGGDMAALHMIKDWLLDHIDNADRAMGRYLQVRG